MTAAGIISVILASAGFVVMLVSLTGLIRFPDFFTRLHVQGVGDTLGALLIILGMMAATGSHMLSLKLLLIFMVIMLTNPVGTNLMMIAAIHYEDYQAYSRVRTGVSSDTEGEEHEISVRPEDLPKPVKPASGPKQSTKQPKPSMRRTRAELIAIAGEMDITVPERATKKDILELIYQQSPELRPQKNSTGKNENAGRNKNRSKRKNSGSGTNSAKRNSKKAKNNNKKG